MMILAHQVGASRLYKQIRYTWAHTYKDAKKVAQADKQAADHQDKQQENPETTIINQEDQIIQALEPTKLIIIHRTKKETSPS